MKPRRELHRYRARRPFWARDGAPVWWQPPGLDGNRFAAVIDGSPWFAVGEAAWFARLREVETAMGTASFAAVNVAATLTPRLEGPRL